MKTYRVITKAGVTSTVQAFGYTEDKTFGRIFFHQDEHRSDRDNFFLLSEVAGIIKVAPPGLVAPPGSDLRALQPEDLRSRGG